MSLQSYINARVHYKCHLNLFKNHGEKLLFMMPNTIPRLHTSIKLKIKIAQP
jgi:hypothetical protein